MQTPASSCPSSPPGKPASINAASLPDIAKRTTSAIHRLPTVESTHVQQPFSTTTPAAITTTTNQTQNSTPTPTPSSISSTPSAAPSPDSAQQPRVFCVEDDERLTAAQHMTAGAVAGMAEHLAMYPVDTVKTRMQSYVALRNTQIGMLHTTRAIISREGLPALWRGVGAVAISAGPAHALYFATYEAVKDVLTGSSDAVHPVATAVAGGCATIVGDGIMTPLDVVKQRMQLSGANVHGSVLRCARYVYANQGIGAFFAGYRATLLMNIPFTAVYFTGYETAKSMIMKWRGISEDRFAPLNHCVAGAAAGAAAAATTNPLDVVKTRLQTQGEVGARRYAGLLDALRSIRIEEGPAGLMRGVRARVLFHMPAAAVCWTTYEFCKHVMVRTGMRGRDGVGLD